MIVDISRGLLETPPYPGERPAALTAQMDMAKGDAFTLNRIDMSLHAATHIDAPLHYIMEGADIAATDLTLYSGTCYVLPAEALMELRQATPRLLLRGEPHLDEERIEKLLSLGVRLIGVETLSVGTADDESGPHIALLSRGLALLENIDLSGAPDGPCVLCAFPLKITGGEASPCRAVLFF